MLPSPLYPLLPQVRRNEKVQECPICLEEMEVGSEVRTLPCAHLYHAACLESWLKQKSSCPMSRRALALTAAIQVITYRKQLC